MQVGLKKLSSFIAISRAGNLANEKEKYEGKQIVSRKSGSIMCSAAPQLNHNVLLPNGDVVLCCMDYSIKHTIGNLLNDDYEKLFKSSAINNIFKINFLIFSKSKSSTKTIKVDKSM